MASLPKKADQWVAEGLITPEQAKAVLAYEDNQKKYVTPFNTFIFIGVFAIACGICALVGAHWKEISDAVKIGGFFTISAAIGAGLAFIKDKKPLVYEAGLFLYALLFFAGIGLVAQIYHLKSDTYKAFLFWSGLAFPLLFITRKTLLGYIWFPVFYFSIMSSPLGREISRFIFKSDVPYSMISFFFFALFLLFYPWKEKKCTQPIAQPALFYSVCGFIIPLLFPVRSFLRYRRRYEEYDLAVAHVETVFILLAVLIGAAVWFLLPYGKNEKKAVLAAVVSYVIFSFMPAFFLAPLCLLLVLSLTAFHLNSKHLFNVLTAAIAIQILVTYFDVFHSLMATGFGLISSGVVIILVAVLWNRIRQIFSAKMIKEGKSS